MQRNRKLVRLNRIATASALGLVLSTGAAFAHADETSKNTRAYASPDAQRAAQRNINAGDDGLQELKAEVREASTALSEATHNAWMLGKLETTYLLNQYLNNFTIDSEVQNSTAYLTGTVDSEIDKELAEQVALSIEGIDKVENNLRVAGDSSQKNATDEVRDGNSFAQRVADATTTAVVKGQLLANEHTDGLDINVETRNDVVTLTGQVASNEEKMLAGELAANTDAAASVINEIQVAADS